MFVLTRGYLNPYCMYSERVQYSAYCTKKIKVLEINNQKKLIMNNEKRELKKKTTSTPHGQVHSTHTHTHTHTHTRA